MTKKNIDEIQDAIARMRDEILQSVDRHSQGFYKMLDELKHDKHNNE